MAISNLPIFAGVFHYGYRIDLDGDGLVRRIEFHFNPRDVTGTHDGAWSMDLLRSDGTALVRGLKLSLGRNKLRRFRYRDGMPAGDIHVVDSSGFDIEPGRDDFGTRVVVQYETEGA